MSGLSAPSQGNNKVGCGTAFMILVGFLFLGGAGYCGYDTYQFVSEAVYIDGHVVGLDASYAEKKDSDGNLYNEVTYYPMVEYRLTEAQKYTIKGSGTTNEYAYSVGQELEVLYLEDHPGQARINTFSELWGLTGVLALLGLICWGFAGLSIWLSRDKS